MKANLSLCKIDDQGRFKYIQIEVKNKSNPEDTKLLIRGNAIFSYHNEIFKNFMTEILNSKDKTLIEDYDYQCLGGGKIEFQGNTISVFGYSSVYGAADHTKTVEIIKKFYPTLNVECTNGGN